MTWPAPPTRGWAERWGTVKGFASLSSSRRSTTRLPMKMRTSLVRIHTHTHKTCILLLYVYNTGSCKNRLLWIWYLEQMMSWIQCCCAGSFLLAIIHIGILCRPSKIGHHSSGQHVSFVILLLYHILVLISLFRWPRVHGGYPAGRGRHRRGSLPTEDIPGNQCFGSVFYWIRIRILAIF